MTDAIREAATPGRSTLLSNATAMYCLQLASYGLPLVTLPYLIRVLGAENYGIMSAAQAGVFLLVFLVDAGFNTRAVRLLSDPAITHDRIEVIYATTQWIKLGFTLLAFLLVLLVLYAGPWDLNVPIYLASFLLVLGSLSFPTWMFQGLEIMRLTLLCNLGGRVIAVLGIFALVRSQDDLLTATVLQSGATLIAGVISLFILRKYHLHLWRPKVKVVYREMKVAFSEVKGLAPSEYLNSLLSSGGVFVLSIFANDVTVGIYAAIEKIARAASNLFHPIIKVLYPRLSGLWLSNNRDQYANDASLWTGRIVLAALLAMAGLYFLAPFVLSLLFGQEWAQYSEFLRFMSVWVFLMVAATTYGHLRVLAVGKNQVYSKIFLSVGLFQLVTAIIGSMYFGVIGLISALVVSECIKLVLLIGASSKNMEVS